MLVAALAGCSGGTGRQEAGSGAITVGFSQVGAESEWRTANTRSVKEALAEPEFQLKFSDGQQKQENQIKAHPLLHRAAGGRDRLFARG